MNRAHVVRLSLSLVLAFGLAACGIIAKSPAPVPAPVNVEIGSGAFAFRNQTVRAGVATLFVNNADVVYTVCLGRDGRCDGSAQGPKDIIAPGYPINPAATHLVTFDQPGTYAITCSGQPQMNMTLYVQ